MFFFVTPLSTPLEYLVGVPNGVLSGVTNKFSMESLIKEMESPMIFKKISGEFPVCFMKMVLDIIFRFPWTHLSSLYHIRHLPEVELDI